MKYIIKYYNAEYDHYPMYLIRIGNWSKSFAEATIYNDKESAKNLFRTQYPCAPRTRDHITILEYTDQEYFKARLKG